MGGFIRAPLFFVRAKNTANSAGNKLAGIIGVVWPKPRCFESRPCLAKNSKIAVLIRKPQREHFTFSDLEVSGENECIREKPWSRTAMNVDQQQALQTHLQAIAQILYDETPA